jgi:transcription elongation factor Elf1
MNKSDKNKLKRKGYCPKCGSTNVATEPIYDDEEGLVDEIALFCLTCGHYLGEVEFGLHAKMRDFQENIIDLYKKSQ